jgi:signal peptidase I
MQTYARLLQEGKTVTFRPHGNSMTPLIKSGQEVTVFPLRDSVLCLGDIVLCKVEGRYYLHKITAIDGDRVQIGNNHGYINGWTSRNKIYGIKR